MAKLSDINSPDLADKLPEADNVSPIVVFALMTVEAPSIVKPPPVSQEEVVVEPTMQTDIDRQWEWTN